jgi:hypothetical protein
MTFDWDQIDRDDAAERAKRDGYLAADYTGKRCLNTICGRNRVMNCRNGRKICEKCGWDQDAKQYSDYLTNG